MMTRADIIEIVPELSFSDQDGYGPENFDFSCPNTGMPCVEKLKLISTYTRDISETTVASGDATDDIWKLNAKLHEYGFWARAGVDCTTSDGCAIRTAMNENTARQSVVTGIRGIRRLFNN